MARRTSLREFQRALSARLTQAATQARPVSFLAVAVGGARCLVSLAEISEVVPVPALSEVPLARDWFRGVTNIRGNLYGVTDLAALEGAAPTTVDAAARLLLVKPALAVNVALLVSSAAGLRLAEGFVEKAAPAADGMAGETWLDAAGVEWRRLMLGRLVTSSAFLEIGR